MPEPDPPPRRPFFVRDYSSCWTLPLRPKPTLSLEVIVVLIVAIATIVLALVSPLVRLARDYSAALLA